MGTTVSGCALTSSFKLIYQVLVLLHLALLQFSRKYQCLLMSPHFIVHAVDQSDFVVVLYSCFSSFVILLMSCFIMSPSRLETQLRSRKFA